MNIFHFTKTLNFQRSQTQAVSHKESHLHSTSQAYGARYELQEWLLFEAVMSDFFKVTCNPQDASNVLLEQQGSPPAANLTITHSHR